MIFCDFVIFVGDFFVISRKLYDTNQGFGFSAEKKLAHAKKLVGWQADHLHARASEMDIELFISEAGKRPAVRDLRDISIRTGNPNKSAFTRAKACTQKQTLM